MKNVKKGEKKQHARVSMWILRERYNEYNFCGTDEGMRMHCYRETFLKDQVDEAKMTWKTMVANHKTE